MTDYRKRQKEIEEGVEPCLDKLERLGRLCREIRDELESRSKSIERRAEALGLTVTYRQQEQPGVTCFIFSDARDVLCVAWSDIEADAFLTREEKKTP